MKPLILNTFDQYSGSALAASRLNQGLQSLGVASRMLVYKKYGADPTVLGPQSHVSNTAARLWRSLDRVGFQAYQKLMRYSIHDEFSVPWLPDWIQPRVAPLNPELINLHWINYGYLQIETLAQLEKPIVWTLHDMWAFTGGCHYSQECDRYTQVCGACPQLHSNRSQDLSHWIWQRKARAWQEINLTLVTPSRWLAQSAQSSSLLGKRRIEVIPNGLDPAIYQPLDRSLARIRLGLPQNKLLILFGAINAMSSRRKGFDLLRAALQHLRQAGWQDKADLVIFGASGAEAQPDLGFQTHYLGKLGEDSALALAYAAADVFVAPSIQENLPNTLVEAMACGTPCVAFKIGGIPEIIEHQQNGYLAQPYQTEDLAQGIVWLVENAERYQKLCHRARQKVEQEFTLTLQARRYIALFEEILTEYHRRNLDTIELTQPLDWQVSKQ